MRFILSCALIAAALAPRPAGAAPAKAEAKPAWVTTVWVNRLQENAAEPFTDSYKGDGMSWSLAWQSWITPEDVPAQYRGRTFKGQSVLRIDVDAAGNPAGCRPLRTGPEPRLDALACQLILKRAHFATRYAGPGQPMPYPFAASIVWRTVSAAEVAAQGSPPPMRLATGPFPPAPAPPSGSLRSFSGWPRLDLVPGSEAVLVTGTPPPIQLAWPGDAEGIVSLELSWLPEKTEAECRIGVSSSVAALDEAACRAAQRLRVRYAEPCEFCLRHTLPLQVVWKKAGSHIRLPLRSTSAEYVGSRQPLPFRLKAGDFAKLPDRSVTMRQVWAHVWVDPDGLPVKCRVQASTGNPAVDARLCEIVVKRVRYTKRTDVFGEPVGDIHVTHLDLTGAL